MPRLLVAATWASAIFRWTSRKASEGYMYTQRTPQFAPCATPWLAIPPRPARGLATGTTPPACRCVCPHLVLGRRSSRGQGRRSSSASTLSLQTHGGSARCCSVVLGSEPTCGSPHHDRGEREFVRGNLLRQVGVGRADPRSSRCLYRPSGAGTPVPKSWAPVEVHGTPAAEAGNRGRRGPSTRDDGLPP